MVAVHARLFSQEKDSILGVGLTDAEMGQRFRFADASAAASVQRELGKGTSRMRTLFEAAGGMDGMRRLAQAWHRRVMEDAVVSHAFSHGFHPHHVERLAAYWAEALGGAPAFSPEYGDETAVVRMHSGMGEHGEMDSRAIACFDEALVDTGLAADPPLRQALHDYFAWATAAMARYPHSPADVPRGMKIPRWSWDGLQR